MKGREKGYGVEEIAGTRDHELPVNGFSVVEHRIMKSTDGFARGWDPLCEEGLAMGRNVWISDR